MSAYGRHQAVPRRAGVRVVSDETVTRLARIAAVLYAATGAAALTAAGVSRRLANRDLLAAVSGGAIVVGVAIVVLEIAWRGPRLQRAFPAMVYGLLVLALVALSLGVYGAGPHFEVGVLLYAVVPIFAFYLLARPMAVAYLALIGICFALVLAYETNVDVPAVQWAYLMVIVSATAVTIGTFVERADLLAASALNGLRRFLSTPVADAVLSGDDYRLLEPHRGHIAVYFCDLRGFTAFAANAQPEEQNSVLTAYFDLLGDAVGRYEATVGGFTGDGLMAFFNDPLPCPDPAHRATTMAIDVRNGMADLLRGWTREGYDLGFGAGIAFGYANIGIIGFEGRRDYTALGPVVNLAARLCAEASDGSILVDQRTHAAIDGRFEMGEGTAVTLKGFQQPVRVWSVAGVAAPDEARGT